MSRSRARAGALLLASLFVVGACGSGATATNPPTARPTTAPTPAPTVGPSAAPASPTASDSGSTGDQARVGDWTLLHPCDLLPAEALATILAAGATETTRGDSPDGGKACTWTGADGRTLAVATAAPDAFERLRAAAAGAQDVAGLGSGAYVVESASGTELVVAGGAIVLRIAASEGREAAEAAARAFLAVLEVL